MRGGGVVVAGGGLAEDEELDEEEEEEADGELAEEEALGEGEAGGVGRRGACGLGFCAFGVRSLVSFCLVCERAWYSVCGSGLRVQVEYSPCIKSFSGL